MISDSSNIGIVMIDQNNATAAWQPVVREETRGLLDNALSARRLDDEASARAVEVEAVSILSRCVPPRAPDATETGLVIGYVQSGKTMSFTTVAALARDNDYHMVIVITGTSIPLHQQSTRRLRRDLRLEAHRARKWQLFSEQPRDDITTLGALRDILHDWRDASIPSEEKQTALITVMKNHRWLEPLRDVLAALDLRGSPVLIIDDEADQASMNTKVQQGNISTTYRCITDIRAVVPHHTFLQYTATPQAPLLINIIDQLSPNFVYVLQPGAGYVGGRDFFGDELRRHIRDIPPQDIGTTNNPLPEPPESLLQALHVFMVGVASGVIQEGGLGNRSMLVHPSHRTQTHQEYLQWVQRTTDNWKDILRRGPAEPDYADLMDQFRSAHDDLAQTIADLPSFDEIMQRLPQAFRRTQILEVNARANETPEIPWERCYGWILVGGQAMDRGFTVEGLTATYMPRGRGVGNADTIQQRARFFGYKQAYLGYCRIYLEQQISAAFRSYVVHEERIRSDLQQYQASGRPLNEWKRAFFMANNLRPTRANVLDLDYMRGRFANDWFDPRYPLAPESLIEENRWVVSNFIDGLEFVPDHGHPQRTDTQRHEVCEDVPLETVLSDLLVQYKLVDSTDSQRSTGLILQLREALDRNSGELCTVFRMSPRAQSERRRGVSPEGRIGQLFQGAYPVDQGRRGSIYPGDRETKSRDRVTVQIHLVTLTSQGDENTILASRVPIIAVWVPRRLEEGWIVQDDA